MDPRNGLSDPKNPQFDISHVYFASELPILSPRQFGLKWADLGPVFWKNRYAKVSPKVLDRKEKTCLILPLFLCWNLGHFGLIGPEKWAFLCSKIQKFEFSRVFFFFNQNVWGSIRTIWDHLISPPSLVRLTHTQPERHRNMSPETIWHNPLFWNWKLHFWENYSRNLNFIELHFNCSTLNSDWLSTVELNLQYKLQTP